MDSIAIICMINNLSRVASQLALVFRRCRWILNCNFVTSLISQTKMTSFLATKFFCCLVCHRSPNIIVIQKQETYLNIPNIL
jgi:hypothetical protein